MGRRRAWRGIHGRIADGVRARRAVGATAGFPRTGTDHDLRTARGRGRSAGRGGRRSRGCSRSRRCVRPRAAIWGVRRSGTATRRRDADRQGAGPGPLAASAGSRARAWVEGYARPAPRQSCSSRPGRKRIRHLSRGSGPCLGDNLVPAIRILPAGREKGTRKPDFCYVSAESGSTRDQSP